MTKYFETFKKIGTILLAGIIIAIIIGPIIGFIYYLNKQGKRLVLYPTIKIEKIENKLDVDTDMLEETVAVTNGILQKMGLK